MNAFRQTLAFFAVCLSLMTGAEAVGDEKVVIPFDFVSKFDDGHYGRKVGDMIFTKLQREGGFILPESMLDVRDYCRANDLHPAPDASMDEIRKIVRDGFDAHIGIFGSIERAPGHDWDVYDLVIKCVDFSTPAEPKTVYQCNAQTKVASEVPHLYVREMLDALYGRKPGEAIPPDPMIERNWKGTPNLVSGDFQEGVDGVPKGWQANGAQPREPLGNKVQWTTGGGSSGNRIVRFVFGKSVGDTYGVMYYSDFFPVEEGGRYRFQCRWQSDGPKAMVFIKCYDEVGTEYSNPSQNGSAVGLYLPEVAQTREVYRSQQNLKGPQDTWNTHTGDFTPKHTKYTPRWGRVMLYAYVGAGVVEFDDVVVKQILPASTSEQIKRRCHSLETRVTIEEMEENERRGKNSK